MNCLQRGGIEPYDKFRTSILEQISQPVTATQVAWLMGCTPSQASYRLLRLSREGTLYCLNPGARIGRLYWLTAQGMTVQKRLRRQARLPPVVHDVPAIDWRLYGSVCFSHRSVVLETLTEPMQPARIKRMAYRKDPRIRFSANNCRDVIRYLRRHGIVTPVMVRRKKHPRYALTACGKHMQRLLVQVGVRW